MQATIFVLAMLLVIAARIAWSQTGRCVEFKKQNDRLRFHRRQMANCLQTCADRLEVFISSDWADEDDQEAHDAALHLAKLARQMEQEEVAP